MPESPRPNPPKPTPAEAGDATPPDPEDSSAQPEGFTLDLSSGPSKAKPASWKRKQKQTSLVFTKVMDLSSPAPEPPVQNVKPRAQKPSTPNAGSPKRGKKRDKPRSGGSTLAELLDPETLARLRGEDAAEDG